MPDLADLLKKWWKFIVAVTLLAMAMVFIITLFLPKKYLSQATAFPARSELADKAGVFNENIQSLYSIFGNADELDKYEGTATLDTLYIATAEKLHLVDQYQLTGEKFALQKAVKRLKKNTDIGKTPYGQLRIKAWDEGNTMAAQIANMLMQEMGELHQNLQQQNSRLALQQLQTGIKNLESKLQQTDSTGATSAGDKVRRDNLLLQLQEYEKLAGEYELVLQTRSPVLLIAEPARPAVWPDRPKRLQILLFTLFAAGLFAFLWALMRHTSKEHA